MTTIYPWVIQLGPLRVTGFGIMMMAAFWIGGWLIGLELRRKRWHEDYAADIVVAAVVGGVIGAKLWYLVLTGDPATILSRSGLVWYGGFLGGVLAVLFITWRRRVPVRATMHLVAPALAAAYALGRIGCFVVGDDYGRPTDFPVGVKFPEGIPPSTAGNIQGLFHLDVPNTAPSTVLAVHPTQLYEVAAMVIVFMILWRWRLAAKPTGWLFGAYLIFAGVERFLVEFLRAKDDRFLGAFTVAQLTSLLVAVAGAIVLTTVLRAEEIDPGDYLRGVPARAPAGAR